MYKSYRGVLGGAQGGERASSHAKRLLSRCTYDTMKEEERARPSLGSRNAASSKAY